MRFIERFISPSREIIPANEKKVLMDGGDFYHSQDVDARRYEDYGFPNAEEATKWREVGCGAVCVEILIHGLKGQSVSLGEIIKSGKELNAYKEGIGWVHNGLISMLRKYDINAYRKRLNTLEDLAALIKNDQALILSVTSGFAGGKRDEEGRVRGKGGHLVVSFGYQSDGASLVTKMLIHDPDYWPPYKKNSIWVPRSDILNSWSGHVIATDCN